MRVCIGVSCYPEDAITAGSLAESADQALYRAKSAGRDQVAFASLEPVRRSEPRLGGHIFNLTVEMASDDPPRPSRHRHRLLQAAPGGVRQASARRARGPPASLPAARVNKQLIHYYFGNKDGLYSAVLGHVAAGGGAGLRQLPLVGLTAVERLRRLVARPVRFLRPARCPHRGSAGVPDRGTMGRRRDPSAGRSAHRGSGDWILPRRYRSADPCAPGVGAAAWILRDSPGHRRLG